VVEGLATDGAQVGAVSDARVEDLMIAVRAAVVSVGAEDLEVSDQAGIVMAVLRQVPDRMSVAITLAREAAAQEEALATAQAAQGVLMTVQEVQIADSKLKIVFPSFSSISFD